MEYFSVFSEESSMAKAQAHPIPHALVSNWRESAFWMTQRRVRDRSRQNNVSKGDIDIVWQQE